MDHDGDIDILACLAREKGRIGLYVCSGGNRGSIGAGQASALEARNLQKNTVVLSGSSAGAATVAYLAAGDLTRSRRIFWREGASKRYVSYAPSRFVRGTTADVGYLCSVFRGHVGEDKLDLEALRSCPADVCGVAVDYQTGEGKIFDLKRAPDPVAVIHASVAMPHLYRKPVFVEGRRYFDGVGMPLPSEKIVTQWNLDGIIVLANRPRVMQWPLARRILESAGIRLLPKHLREAARRRHAQFEAGISFLRRNKVQHLVLWTDDSLSFVEQNPALIESGSNRGYQYMDQLCVRAGI